MTLRARIAENRVLLAPGVFDALSALLAERAGAEITTLDGLGHWWMCEDPARAAQALNRFWAGLD